MHPPAQPTLTTNNSNTFLMVLLMILMPFADHAAVSAADIVLRCCWYWCVPVSCSSYRLSSSKIYTHIKSNQIISQQQSQR
mmetsp:Transcript_17932/g.20575  ORF Transcript_17932/g.20575 Transcript_17932/m.20575 type:complete len:81 (-) Transcript_17932:24-266(-)